MTGFAGCVAPFRDLGAFVSATAVESAGRSINKIQPIPVTDLSYSSPNLPPCTKGGFDVMSWDLFRICWPNAAMPFALALMPLVGLIDERQTTGAQTSPAQIERYEMAAVSPPASFEQIVNQSLTMCDRSDLLRFQAPLAIAPATDIDGCC